MSIIVDISNIHHFFDACMADSTNPRGSCVCFFSQEGLHAGKLSAGP